MFWYLVSFQGVSFLECSISYVSLCFVLFTILTVILTVCFSLLRCFSLSLFFFFFFLRFCFSGFLQTHWSDADWPFKLSPFLSSVVISTQEKKLIEIYSLIHSLLENYKCLCTLKKLVIFTSSTVLVSHIWTLLSCFKLSHRCQYYSQSNSSLLSRVFISYSQ